MYKSTKLDLFPYPFRNIKEGTNYRYSNDLKKLEKHEPDQWRHQAKCHSKNEIVLFEYHNISQVFSNSFFSS